MSRAAHLGLMLLALSAAACRREPPAGAPANPPGQAPSAMPGAVPAPTQATVPIGNYGVDHDGVQIITIGPIRIEAAADLPHCPLDSTTTVTANNTTVVTLRGWQVVLAGGRVHVASQDFGPAPDAATIRLAKDGVHVGGEHRGALPGN